MDLASLILDNILSLIMLVDLLLILTLLFWERSDPSSATLWVVVLILLPIAGFFLYLFFGQTIYSDRTFRKKAEMDRSDEENIIEKISENVDEYIEKELKEHPENVKKIRMVRALKETGSNIYYAKNNVMYFGEGEKYFNALLNDLRNAETSINFEYYIVRNDKISTELMNILIERSKAGVKVRLMIDAIGNGKGPKKKIRELKNAGGKYSLFHSTATCLLSPRKNNRNHRKIAVIDGKIAYVGGYNIGDEYLGEGPFGHWRDSAVRMEGPGVIDVQLRFLLDWRYATKEDCILDVNNYNLIKNKEWKDSTQLVSGGPDQWNANPIQIQYYNIVTNANDKLYIHTPYLEPDQTLLDALRNASRSGVDVKVIIPDIGDHPFVYWANRYYANLLMEAGVRIYEYNNGFVHSKTLVADSYWCSVGSANFDKRSVKLNFETNLMIYSDKIGKEMEDAFMNDLNHCTEYTVQKYSERTLFQKIKTSFCRILSSQL